jgi:hypothetical protein
MTPRAVEVLTQAEQQARAVDVPPAMKDDDSLLAVDAKHSLKALFDGNLSLDWQLAQR